MKFLCCSDTHGLTPPPLDETNASAWLHAGDVYNHGEMTKSPKGILASKLLEWINSRTMPVFVVKGNHDCSFDAQFFHKANDITGRCRILNAGLSIIGLGWAGGEFFDLPTERDMERIIQDAKRDVLLRSGINDKFIVLTHYPFWDREMYDYKKNPEGWMFECIRNYIDELKPLVIIQGHVHEFMGKQFVYNRPEFASLVVFPGPKGGTLEIDLEASSANFQFANQGK